jgi:hypothetical protein
LFVDIADHHGCLLILLTITVSTNNRDGQPYQQTTVMVSHINKQP